MSTLDSYFGTQPPPKRTKTSEEKKDSQKNYEKSKRKRSYCVDWEKDFTWLQNSDDEGMTCKTCKKYEKEGQWVEGSSNYRIEAVRKHGSSETHMKNVKKQMATSIPPSESTAEKTLLMMKKAAFNKLTLLFRNAHYIGKNNRPYTDYISLCALDKAKDLDIGDTYMTDKSCQMFIHAISSARQNEQDDIIKNSSFISVISDGSTDVSSKEAEIIYVRCSVKCRVSTLFIGVKNVAKADGNNISIAISTLLTERFQQSWKDKLIAMGTDGASVMLGKSSGVVKRISDMTSKPVHAIHCSAHRIELAYKDAIKMVKIWQRCDALMLNIYLFYKYSPLNRSNLQASFKSLDQKMLTPTRVGGTRWVPHHERALTTILHGKEAITQHLEQMQVPGESRKDSSAKARNFLKALKDKNVSFWLHFMLDVIKTLSTVSRTVQSKNSTVGDVYNELESCKTILNKYMKSDGPNVRKYLKASTNGDEKILETSRNLFLSRLIQAISTRFEGDLHLFKGCTVLSFNKWPSSLDEDTEFGDTLISELVDVCSPGFDDTVDADSIESEWTRFKCELYSSKKSLQMYTWEAAADAYMTKYPNLFTMVNYLLTLPSCSVDAERGFSSMKMIKNDWRSRLSANNLSDLMLVSLETENVDAFDPTKAIHLWSTEGVRSRRPFYKDNLKKSCTDDILIDVATSAEVEMEVNEDEEIETDNDYNLVQNVYLEAEKLEDEDDSISDDEDELYYNNKDILSLQQKSYKLFQELMEN